MENMIQVSFKVDFADEVIKIGGMAPTSPTLVSDLINLNPQYFSAKDSNGRLYLCTTKHALQSLDGSFSTGGVGYAVIAQEFVDGMPLATDM